MKKIIIALLVLSLIMFACKKNDSPAEPSAAPSDTPIVGTPTDTGTPTQTGTPTETGTNTQTATPTETATETPTAITYFTFDTAGEVNEWTVSGSTYSKGTGYSYYISPPSSMLVAINTSSYGDPGYVVHNFPYPVDLSGHWIAVPIYLPASMAGYDISMELSDGTNTGTRSLGTVGSSGAWDTFEWDLITYPPASVTLSSVTSARIIISKSSGSDVNTSIYFDNIDFND